MKSWVVGGEGSRNRNQDSDNESPTATRGRRVGVERRAGANKKNVAHQQLLVKQFEGETVTRCGRMLGNSG